MVVIDVINVLLLWAPVMPSIMLLLAPIASSMDTGQLENHMDTMAAQILSCKEIVGFSIGMVKNDSTVLSKGYGYSNLERQTAVTEDTLFGIASLSKAFTSTLVCKLLHEHHTFNIDTQVRDILGEDLCFADPVLHKLATVKDLMTHRTGLPKYNRARMQDNFDRKHLLRSMRYYNRTEQFRDKYMYNNLMYGLLTVITERLGGDTWENLMTKHIFKPLGMDSSTFTHETDLTREDLAVPYWRQNNGSWKAVSQVLHREWGKLGGSGSIISNEVDMLKWVKFQLSLGVNSMGQQIIPKQVMEETHKAVISIPECSTCKYYRRPYSPVTLDWSNYALGWRTGFYRGLPIVTHTGSSYGYTAKLTLVPDLGIGIHVGITGTDPGFEGRRALHSYAMDLLMGETPVVAIDNVCHFPYSKPVNKPKKSNITEELYPTMSVKQPHIYTGIYTNYGFGDVNIYCNTSDNQLHLSYGSVGLWDMYMVEGESHTFNGVGRSHVWHIKIKSLIFSQPDQNGHMTQLKIPDFESANPPVFERDLEVNDPTICPTEALTSLSSQTLCHGVYILLCIFIVNKWLLP